MLIRLDKALASQGRESRKEINKLIRSGLVAVNGSTVKSGDIKIDLEKDRITVNERELSLKKHIYIMMNKPQGVVCATHDRLDKTVIDILPDHLKRKGLFPVGRLDKDTEGLILITDDGDFAHRVISPVKKIYKEYIAVVDGKITDDDIRRFEQGVVFADGTKCRSAGLYRVEKGEKYTARVKICEGKFHQVKKMFKVCGKNVLKLKRVSIGNLILDVNLHKGMAKELDILDVSHIFGSKID